MLATIVEFPHEAMVPIPLVPMLPTLLSENGVVSKVLVEGEARIKPGSIVCHRVIVAEVVVTVVGTQEEVVREGVEPDHNRRRINVGRRGVHVGVEADGCKQGSTTSEGVIPVAVYKDVAAGRPDVM